MGKKKKTSQSSNTTVNHGGSSESESSKDSSQATEGSKVICCHINKSAEIGTLRSSIKSNKDDYLTCKTCKKIEDKDSCQDGWVCLRCSSYNCGPNDRDHRTEHFKKPHSDPHFLAYQLSTNTVWCLKCDKEIPVDVNKKVQNCVDVVKKQFASGSQKPVFKQDTSTDSEKMNANNNINFLKTDSSKSHVLENSLPTKEIKPVLNLPKVKGLMNLGNTCFFNSVLQCLAQTPGLVSILEEMDAPGKRFHLELDGTVIDGVLEKHKSSEVSEQLARVLKELAAGGSDDEANSYYGAVNPRELLKALTNKCPQFEGGDQHDSHELLRHLLDSVYKEDLKRYQAHILNHIGYKNKNLDMLDEEDKERGKKLNQKVCDTIVITPEQLFQGSLVSILECTECLHISKREETFLDLSLPVALEKPQPPGSRRKQTGGPEQFYNASQEEKEKPEEAAPMSKHQMKKAKREAKRSKTPKYAFQPEENKGEPTIEEENKKDSLEGEPSDADVEDNDENVCDPKREVVESGYSSEKQASARGSPVTTRSTEDLAPVTDLALAADRAESGLGSIQELTVTIPEECSSRESVQVNASNGSPDISSDSQLGNIDLCSEYQLPLGSDTRSFSREMVLDWNCAAEPATEYSLNSSLSVSPHCSSRDNRFASLPTSNENMSICDSFPENGSLLLNTKDDTSNSSDNGNVVSDSDKHLELNSTDLPKIDNNATGDAVKSDHSTASSPGAAVGPLNPNCSAEETSGSVELNPALMEDGDNSCTQIRRCSPVEPEVMAALDSRLLKLSLEGAASEGGPDRSSSPVPRGPIYNDQGQNGFELVGGVNMIPQPPPSPPNLYTHPEPSIPLYDSFHSKHRIEEGECSLQSCLNQFTTIEMLAGGNKVGCEACTEKMNKGNKDGKTVYQNSSKQLLICKTPSIMIFHLKRFQVQRCSFRKISRHVDFPLVLNISPFCEPEKRTSGPILYSLYGVVEHSGTLHGGHYVAYVKVRSFADKRPGIPPPGKWYYISDSRVCNIEENEVLKKQAYLLFYEKIL